MNIVQLEKKIIYTTTQAGYGIFIQLDTMPECVLAIMNLIKTAGF